MKLGIELRLPFFFLDYGWRDAAGHGPLYDDFSYPSPAIDFNMELPWFRLLRRRFFFVMLCTGASASVNGLS